MNILFVDQFGETGGAQLCLLSLLPAVLERGWKAHLMAPEGGALLHEAAKLGVETHHLPIGAYACGRKKTSDVLRFGVDVLRAASAIRTLIKQSAIDLIYANGPRVLPAVACACRRPTLFHAHSSLNPAYARCLAQWSLRRTSARIIAASSYVAESYRTLAPSAKMQVIYNGVSDLWQGRGTRDFGQLRIGIAGRIAPEKGHLDFVEAARILARKRTDLRFAVYGSALFSGTAYESLVRDASTGLPVEFFGWHPNIAAVLKGLDIVVVPSASNDAAPRIVIEALSAGTPVIAYRSGGIPELLGHGTSGFLTTAPTPEALAEAIEHLADDSQQRSEMSANGRRRWKQRFTLERYQREICEVLQEVAGMPTNDTSSSIVEPTCARGGWSA